MVPLLLTAAAIAGGTLLVGLFDPPSESRPFRIAAGAGLGFPLLGLTAFVLASWFGLTLGVVLSSAALVVGVPLALAVRRRPERAGPRARRVPEGLSVALAVYVAVAVTFFYFFFAGAAYERGGAIATAEWNNIGDLGFHIAIVEGFVKGQNFPPEHPEFAGARLTYPFLCDFIAAMYVVAGLPLTAAFLWQNLVMATALLLLFMRWCFVLTRDRVAAYLVPILVLFSGGFGFYTLVREAQESGQSVLAAVREPQHAVTILWGSWSDVLRWGNPLTTFFLPQRAWLLGLPLALLAWTWWWQAVQTDNARLRDRLFVLAGLATGLLPLAHTHSLLVMGGMGACLTLLFWPARRGWFLYLMVLAILAVPQVVWVSQEAAARTGNFVAWHYGWSKPPELPLSLLQYWLLNTGLTFPLALVALLRRAPDPLVPPRLVRFLAPFVLCLIVPNLVRLSPWEWDTNKVLFYGYLAAVLPLAVLLAHLFRGAVPAKIVGAAALGLLTVSGAIDVWRVLSGREHWVHFDATAREQAALIEAHTPPRARVLAAFSSTRALLLTGRRSLVGHPWTMWSHGIDAEARLEDMRRIFAGAPEAGALIERYRIDYVLIGGTERAELSVNDAYFAQFEKVGEAGGASLFKVRRS
jgi:hypothetical protein